MTFEERMQELETRKRNLQTAFSNNEVISVGVTNENDEGSLVNIEPTSPEYLSHYQEERESIDKQIKLLRLEDDYENKRPLMYHFVDSDGQEDDIELGSNDVDYEKAYRQQMEFIKNGKQSTDEIMKKIHQEIEMDKEVDRLMAEIHSEKETDAEIASSDEKVINEEEKEEIIPEQVDYTKLTDEELQAMLDEFKNEYVYRAHHENGLIEHDDLLEQISAVEAEINRRKEAVKESETEKEVTNNIEISKPYAVIKSGNTILIVGDLTVEEVKFVNSDSYLINKYNDLSKKVFSNDVSQRKHVYPNMPGVVLTVNADGTFMVDGADEVEFHNQPAFVIKSDVDENKLDTITGDSKANNNLNDDFDVRQVLEWAKNDQRDKIMALIADKGYINVREKMYDAFFDIIQTKDEELTPEQLEDKENYYKFIDITNELYDEKGNLKDKNDNIPVIDGDPIIPPTAQHVKSREKNDSLFSKFKKHLPKILLGAAAIGLGVFLALHGSDVVEFFKNLTTGGVPHVDTSTVGPQLTNTTGGIVHHIGDMTRGFIQHANETVNGVVANMPQVGDVANTAVQASATPNIVAIGDSWAPGAVSGFIRTTAANPTVGGAVDLSNVDTIYATLDDAINGTNGLPISSYARTNIVGVYDQLTGALKTAADAIGNIVQGGRSI